MHTFTSSDIFDVSGVVFESSVGEYGRATYTFLLERKNEKGTHGSRCLKIFCQKPIDIKLPTWVKRGSILQAESESLFWGASVEFTEVRPLVNSASVKIVVGLEGGYHKHEVVMYSISNDHPFKESFDYDGGLTCEYCKHFADGKNQMNCSQSVDCPAGKKRSACDLFACDGCGASRDSKSCCEVCAEAKGLEF